MKYTTIRLNSVDYLIVEVPDYVTKEQGEQISEAFHKAGIDKVVVIPSPE